MSPEHRCITLFFSQLIKKIRRQCKHCTSLRVDVEVEMSPRLVLASSSLGDRRLQQTRAETLFSLYSVCSKEDAKTISDSRGTTGASEYAAGLWPVALLRGRVNTVNDGETAPVSRFYKA